MKLKISKRFKNELKEIWKDTKESGVALGKNLGKGAVFLGKQGVRGAKAFYRESPRLARGLRASGEVLAGGITPQEPTYEQKMNAYNEGYNEEMGRLLAQEKMRNRKMIRPMMPPRRMLMRRPVVRRNPFAGI